MSYVTIKYVELSKIQNYSVALKSTDIQLTIGEN